MKKSFSHLNILQKQLSGIVESKKLFHSFFPKHKYVEISIPLFDYVRGKVFVEDLRDNYQDEVPYQMDIAFLFFLLYKDFLNQVKRGIVKNNHVSNYLMAGKNRHFQKQIQQKRLLKPLTPRMFEFETIIEEEEVKPQENQTACIVLRIRETELLRGEILLHDLFSNTDFEISVEELISIVYLDFIEQIKNEGNSLKVQKSILTHIKSF